MASVVTQVTAPTFPGAGQPVGTGTGQANAPLINPAHRALPVLPELDSLPQEPALLEFHKLLSGDAAAAARDNGKDFVAEGEKRRPKCGDTDREILGTIAPDAEALAAIGHPCDLKGRLERGEVDYLLERIPNKIPVGPDNTHAEVRKEIRAGGWTGKDGTKTELRQAAVNVHIAADPVLRMARAKKAHGDVETEMEGEQTLVETLQDSVEFKKRKIVELQADVDREQEAINNKKAHAAKVKQAADDLLVQSEELFKINEARAAQKIIGLNCKGSEGATRTGILDAMGLHPDSTNYKAVKFDKVVDGLVHTAVFNNLVKKLTAHREIMAWADTMPEAKKKELMDKLSGAGSSGD
jgi:hypothetical protein